MIDAIFAGPKDSNGKYPTVLIKTTVRSSHKLESAPTEELVDGLEKKGFSIDKLVWIVDGKCELSSFQPLNETKKTPFALRFNAIPQYVCRVDHEKAMVWVSNSHGETSAICCSGRSLLGDVQARVDSKAKKVVEHAGTASQPHVYF